jgi:hypothetical protein
MKGCYDAKNRQLLKLTTSCSVGGDAFGRRVIVKDE